MRHLILAIIIVALGAIVLAHHDQKPDAFAIVLGDSAHITNFDIESYARLRKAVRGDFIWVRRDRKSYVIQDADIVHAARNALRRLEPLYEEEKALEMRTKPFEAREDDLDRQMETLEEKIERAESRLSEVETRKLEGEMRELESKLREVERELRDLERIEEDIDRRQDRVEDQVDREIERLIDRAFQRGLAVRWEGKW